MQITPSSILSQLTTLPIFIILISIPLYTTLLVLQRRYSAPRSPSSSSSTTPRIQEGSSTPTPWMKWTQWTSSLTHPHNKPILLLIAHPDDEAMFFAPTLLGLTKKELGNRIQILCLSDGDADGLGEIRIKELKKSGMLLGLAHEDDISVIQDPKFPDSMTTTWNTSDIADLLTRRLTSPSSSSSSSSKIHLKIDILITFDQHGISSHPNHCSLFHGAKHFISNLRQTNNDGGLGIQVYTLTTTSLFRKYAFILDFPFTIWGIITSKTFVPGRHLFFVNSPSQVRTAQRAMTKAHRSQMRWFRWGWIGLSRYMVMNDLELVNPIELNFI